MTFLTPAIQTMINISMVLVSNTITLYGIILHLHQNKPAYKQHTFRIDFDPFRMILTSISVANTYIVRYQHHPQQAWGPVGMRGFWVREDKRVFTLINKHDIF